MCEFNEQQSCQYQTGTVFFAVSKESSVFEQVVPELCSSCEKDVEEGKEIYVVRRKFHFTNMGDFLGYDGNPINARMDDAYLCNRCGIIYWDLVKDGHQPPYNCNLIKFQDDLYEVSK